MEIISEIVRLSGTNAKKQQDTTTDQNTVVSHSLVRRARRNFFLHSR